MIRRVSPGEPLEIPAAAYNAFADAAEAVLSGERGTARRPSICKLVTRGPNQEADFDDARYWVREQLVAIDPVTHAVTIQDKPDGLHCVAINLQEIGRKIHGCLAWPSRVKDPPGRYVVCSLVCGTLVFDAVPATLVPLYWFDSTCLDEEGCPEGRWWKGHGLVAIEDDDAGDGMPDCGD